MTKQINELISGYQQFRERYFDNSENNTFERLVKLGQRPKALVIACSDSRVDPSVIMNCEPGDLFVVRNVANLVPPCENKGGYHGTSAAIEFAIKQLDLPHIIVLGHSHCGGIQSLVENVMFNQEGFINTWMRLAQRARQEAVSRYPDGSLDQQMSVCCQYALIHSLENLMTFPWIAEKVAEKKLFLHGWYLNLIDGLISHYNPILNNFELLS